MHHCRAEAGIGSMDHIKQIHSVMENKCLNLSATLPLITFLELIIKIIFRAVE